MTRRFAEAYVTRNDGIEHHVGEMPLEFFVNLIGQTQAGVVHRQQESFDFERRIKARFDYADRVQELAYALQSV